MVIYVSKRGPGSEYGIIWFHHITKPFRCISKNRPVPHRNETQQNMNFVPGPLTPLVLLVDDDTLSYTVLEKCKN